MPRNLKTQAQLQAEINQLKAENQQLRLLLHTVVLTASQAVNSEPDEGKKEENHECKCWAMSW